MRQQVQKAVREAVVRLLQSDDTHFEIFERVDLLIPADVGEADVSALIDEELAAIKTFVEQRGGQQA